MIGGPVGDGAGAAGPVTALPRVLGPVDGAALVVANVVGVGIFVTPGIVAELAGDPIAVLAAWVAGGLLALAGASAYAELAARRPKAGGEFVYITEAFGRLPGFLSGWTSFVAGFSGAIAASAVGFAEYLGRLVPAAGDAAPLVAVPLGIVTPAVSPRALVALAVVGAFTWLHARSTRGGIRVQNALVAGKLALGVGFACLALAFGAGRWEHLAPGSAAVSGGGWMLALIPVMFTYSGWNAAAYVAEEVREPGRNVMRALMAGTGVVILLYLLLNVVFLYALPVEALRGVVRVGDVAAEALFGAVAATAVTVLVLFALGTGLGAMIVAGPRVYLAMARGGLFPRAAARLSPRTGTPRWAILAQGVWSGILVLSGGFVQLVTYTGFAIMLFAALAVLGLFVMRRREPAAAAARAFGYPVVPACFVVVSLAAVVNAVVRAPGPSLAGLGVIGLGVPVYLWLDRASGARVPRAGS